MIVVLTILSLLLALSLLLSCYNINSSITYIVTSNSYFTGELTLIT